MEIIQEDDCYENIYFKEQIQHKDYLYMEFKFHKHLKYAKIGICKEKKKELNYAFSDDTNGFSIMTNGQYRYINRDGSNQIFKEIPLDKEAFIGVLFDIKNKKISISKEPSGVLDNFTEVYSHTEKDDLKINKWFVALAIRGKETVTINY